MGYAKVSKRVHTANKEMGCVTYQVADHDLALTGQTGTFAGSRLGCSPGRLGGFLDATGGGSCRLGANRATLGAATALAILALAGEDLVQRLIEFAHDDGGK